MVTNKMHAQRTNTGITIQALVQKICQGVGVGAKFERLGGEHTGLLWCAFWLTNSKEEQMPLP